MPSRPRSGEPDIKKQIENYKTMIKDFVQELEWRGMIHTIMPGAKEQLQKEMTTAYLGIDPTADSLHIGHLVGVMILKHFQMCGCPRHTGGQDR